MGKIRIKKEDQVYVIAGKDRDLQKARRVLQVMPGADRVLVEGANLIKRHTRPNPQKNIKGGIVERESPLHVSNVMIVDPDTKRPSRIGTKVLEDGKRVRVASRSGAVLPDKN
ncbi:MAG: 50S ribosomal protein L24 [bacterium]|nr:50S ribosomal protein L24 [bacterium]